MKCLMVNTFEGEGGAARSAKRLHRALLASGINSRMLVQAKISDDPTMLGPQGRLAALLGKARGLIDALPLLAYRSRLYPPWSLGWLPGNIDTTLAAFDPDVIHLHWTNFGFLPIKAIGKFQKPLVWTLHDSWPFTGGCHLPFDCTRYRDSCGACPQLNCRHEKDLSRLVWQNKRKHWRNLDPVIVAPSTWLASCARSSSLLGECRIEVIPNGIDVAVYVPLEKSRCRERWGIPPDVKVILAGAASFGRDVNKGIDLLQKASRHLQSSGLSGKTEIVLFGAADGIDDHDFGLPCHCVGTVADEAGLAELYSAADVFVLPSLQENLPNTLIEAMACGVPVVAFAAGGVIDIIDHGVQGYCAKPYDPADLAQGIQWVLSDEKRHAEMAVAARSKVLSKFTVETAAARYTELYQELLSAR